MNDLLKQAIKGIKIEPQIKIGDKLPLDLLKMDIIHDFGVIHQQTIAKMEFETSAVFAFRDNSFYFIINAIRSRYKWHQATWAIPVGDDEELARDKLNSLMLPLIKAAGVLESPDIHKTGVYDQIVWRLAGTHLKRTLDNKGWPVVYAVIKDCFENTSSQGTRYWENGTEVAFILGQRNAEPILGVSLRIHTRHAFTSLNSQPFIMPVAAVDTLLKRIKATSWKKTDTHVSSGRDEVYDNKKVKKSNKNFFFPMFCWLIPLCFFGLLELSDIFKFMSEGAIGTFISLGLIASIITGSVFTIKYFFQGFRDIKMFLHAIPGACVNAWIIWLVAKRLIDFFSSQ